MIKTEAEYREAIRRFKQDLEVAALQREELESMGLTPQEVQKAMEPLLSFQAQLTEEITWYENVKRRHFDPTRRLTDVGRLLIALRLANGMTQKQLADKLGVSEAAVSRDERNEYHGITLERAQRVLDALAETITSSVEERSMSFAVPAVAEEERSEHLQPA